MNMGKSNSNMGVSNSNMGVSNSNMGVSNSKMGVSNSNMGVSNSNMGVSNSNTGVSNSNMGVGNSNMGVSNSNMGVSNSNMGVSNSNMGVSNSNMGVGNSNMGVGNSNNMGVRNSNAPVSSDMQSLLNIFFLIIINWSLNCLLLLFFPCVVVLGLSFDWRPGLFAYIFVLSCQWASCSRHVPRLSAALKHIEGPIPLSGLQNIFFPLGPLPYASGRLIAAREPRGAL
ncbi:unnamed protein product [Lymnaea stagnalis]|uniref:Uncharacterized protein n=1 Tax=Lymnaea stagnalis TaxID=6523 RepID=A0AAV2HXK0_LYMST